MPGTRCFSLVLLILLLTILTLSSLLSQEPAERQSESFFVREKNRNLVLLERIGQLELKAREALDQAQLALKGAEEQNDAGAASLAHEALVTAESARDKASANRIKIQTKLKAIEQGLEWESQGKELGVATVVKGELYKNSALGWVAFDPGVPLVEGDEIKTGENGYAEFVLTDGSRVQLTSNSTLKVIELGEKKSTYDLIKGAVHATWECLTKASAEDCGIRKYRRSNIAVAIRGTEFVLEGLHDGATRIAVLKGHVEVVDTLTMKKYEVKESQQIVITGRRESGRTKTDNLESLIRWWEGE